MVSKKYGYRPVFILVRHVLALMLLICLMSRDYAIYAVGHGIFFFLVMIEYNYKELIYVLICQSNLGNTWYYEDH